MRLVTSKNAGVALDHEPAGVDPGAADVGEQRLEHLGDAAADGGRVDVEDRTAGECLAHGVRSAEEALGPFVADHGREQLRRRGLHLHLGQPDAQRTSSRAASIADQPGPSRLRPGTLGLPP